MKKWKILKKIDVSPSRWFPVFQHTVELGGGTIVDDYFVSPLGNVVIILPITKNNEVVLVRQYKHALGEILLELPAGFQQKNRTLEESAVAELEEEVGIKTSIDNLVPLGKIANIPTKTSNVAYGYLAKDLEFNSMQNTDETEEIEIVKVSPRKLIKMVMNEDIWVGDSLAFILKALNKYPELFK